MWTLNQLKKETGPVSTTELPIIAIDFGTSYSGYAFSLTPRGAQNEPCLRRWGKELGMDTPKTPTCILFNEHKKFLKFGYEAKTAFINLRGEEAKKNYFFENFKVVHYDKKFSRNVIKAANGKSMKASKVFTEALRYLSNDAMETIKAKSADNEFTESDLTWVLTVPAFWDSSAEQFMRKAATQVGIITEGTQHNLIIALEPEAASVWCKKLPAASFITQNHDGGSLDQSPGTQFIVVDCGGGTVDITVHEVLDEGALKDLDKASGNDLGGQTVDRKFKEFLREIFSDHVWDEYEANSPSEVQILMYKFVYFKQVDDDIHMSCPYNLGTLAESRQEIEKFFESVEGASWECGAIRISKERLRSFFAESLKGITDSLKEILKKHLNIKYILLVGGYAESLILRQHVIDQFGDQCKVFCPFSPQEVILKGAVEFGRNQAVVASRKSAFTYGVSVCEKFDLSKHRADKKFIAHGEEFCSNIFMTLVEEGENVGWNEVRKLIFNPISAGQTGMEIKFCRTKIKDPLYTDEDGVKEIGLLKFRMPSKGGVNHAVKLEIRFGSSEMKVTGTGLVSDLKLLVKMDFMTKT
ncbi:heat shock 70 kDa protein 12A-like [Pelmatolapia mariae]|uniref:heat shock 70 kDa protein 12A-like n=1 Tax=Pelmatolapia mariae TaxID=158779 RepID=UPI002FE64DBC